jgi:hypothetical protein
MLALTVLSSITKKGEIVRNMAPLGYNCDFGVCDNIVIGIVGFLGPMDVVQSIVKVSKSLSRCPSYSETRDRIYLGCPNRIYVGCPNDRIDELDKCSKITCVG